MPISTATGLQRWCLMRTISLVFPTKPSKVSRRQLLFSQRSPQSKFLGGGKSITVTSSIYYLSLSQCFSKPYPLASSTLHNLFSFLILFNSALCFSPPFPFVQQYFKEKKKRQVQPSQFPRDLQSLWASYSACHQHHDYPHLSDWVGWPQRQLTLTAINTIFPNRGCKSIREVGFFVNRFCSLYFPTIALNILNIFFMNQAGSF